MARKAFYALVLLAVLIGCLVLLPGHASSADGDRDAEPVEVVNLPEVQRVEGRVQVERPLPQAELMALDEAIAVPADPRDPSQLVFAGTVTTDGYNHVVLSLGGEARGRGAGGRVGAFLVPDLDPVLEAFRLGEILFPLEVSAELPAQGRWIQSGSERRVVAFPRYRVYLYNTAERSAAVRLYAYLTG